MERKATIWIVMGVIAWMTSVSSAGVMEITEWMYKGINGEFIEFTNVSGSAIDMAGWSYSDTDKAPGDVDLSAFGIVMPGQSVILTDADASEFRAAWEIPLSVKVIGGNENSNLGRSDEIHLYDGSEIEVDSLVYNDQVGQGPRTENKSCNIPALDYGYTTARSCWTQASVGDCYGSWKSSGNDIGSPGQIPEPATMTVLGLGAVVIGIFRRRGARQ